LEPVNSKAVVCMESIRHGHALPHVARDAGARRERIRARVWKEPLHLLLDLPVGVVGFTFVVTGLALGVGLAITLLGIPVLAGTLVVVRRARAAELARARALLGCDRAPPALPAPPQDRLARLLAPIRDASAWKAAAYFTLMLPVGVVTFTVTVAWWGTALALSTLPAWAWALPHNGPAIGDGYHWSHPWQLALSTLAGLLMVVAAPAVIHGVSLLDRALLRLLGGSKVDG
jgi:hypothetical protein